MSDRRSESAPDHDQTAVYPSGHGGEHVGEPVGRHSDSEHADRHGRPLDHEHHPEHAHAEAPGQAHGHPHAREVEARRHERFGGANTGAAFFGWLVAFALTVLLVSVLGAIAAAVGDGLDVSRTDAAGEARAIGLSAVIVLLVILLIGYFAGGYVAGRMSRYDGGRQGLAVWLIGLLVTVAAAVLGVVFGRQYDVLERVNLPSIPIPDDTLTTGGVITLIVVVVGTLLAAMLGGKAGHRYHTRVDRFTG